MEDAISHISDTAFWIAGFRALENNRPDAVFKDPLAALLAGERGAHMVSITPHSEAMAFAMTIRTIAIDRLVEKAIEFGANTVINMAAGLDTRPYRMNLSSSLQWIEIDLPGILEYKSGKLKDELPRCHLQRIASDLSDNSTRKKLFDSLGSQTNKALVITEGLIAYLKASQAEDLSKDLLRIPAFAYWVQDYARGGMRRNRGTRALAKMVRQTPFQFDINEPINFFCSHGWTVKENIYILDEADRIGRSLPLMFPWSLLTKMFPDIIRKIGNRTYGYVMFEKK